jgi:hypothetical protein
MAVVSHVAMMTLVRRGVVMALVLGVVWLCHHRAGKSNAACFMIATLRHNMTAHRQCHTRLRAQQKINFFPQMNRK